MAKITQQAYNDRFKRLSGESDSFGETNDCSVIAISLLCDVSYDVAHRALAASGRKEKRGARMPIIRRAILALGMNIQNVDSKSAIGKYPGCHVSLKSVTTHHPARFNKAWKDGCAYMFVTAHHCLAVVDGVVQDWSANRALRVTEILQIINPKAVAVKCESAPEIKPTVAEQVEF